MNSYIGSGAVRGLFCLLFMASILNHGNAVTGPLEKYHRPLDGFLKKYVRRESRVADHQTYIRTVFKYAELKKDEGWPKYVQELAYVSPAELKSAPLDDQKAFWINTFNVLVIDTILQHYPIVSTGSGTQLGHSVQAIRDFWVEPHYVGKEKLSLSAIRERVAAYGDIRMLLALCDGAVSSPALPEARYDPSNLNQQLDRAAANFAADDLKFRIVKGENRIRMSGIFEQHKALFQKGLQPIRRELGEYSINEARVISYLWDWLDREDKMYISSRRLQIAYEPFDWALNDAQ